MPELMQLGPDDTDINPYLSPCPSEYPPCPLCGKHPDMLETGHIICCNIMVDSSDAWFLLPRAIRWTHEPPKVAGWYWWRSGPGQNATTIRVHEYIKAVFLGEPCDPEEKVIGYWDQNGTFRTDIDRGEWAGPIPAPIEP